MGWGLGMRRGWVIWLLAAQVATFLALVAGPARGSTAAGAAAGTPGAAPHAVGMVATPDGQGYWLADARGAVVGFGSAPFVGSEAGTSVNAPVAAMAARPDGRGYWLVGADGTVQAFGQAGFYGSAPADVVTAPVVAMAPTPDGGGYWLLERNWAVLAFGDAVPLGSPAGVPLGEQAVGLAPTGDGRGYWVAGSGGDVVGVGDASLRTALTRPLMGAPVVGVAADPDGSGYWIVAADGEVAASGGAPSLGSLPRAGPATPVVGMAAVPGGRGYWLVGADGGVFAFGDAPYLGGVPLPASEVRIGIFGDSLASEARGYLTFVAERLGIQVVGFTFGGTAPCDALDAVAADADFLHLSAAVIEFSGNAFTPCMSGYPAGTPAFFGKYRQDVGRAADLLRAGGARVYLAGSPPTSTAAGSVNLERLNRLYAEMASGSAGVAYIDAGRAVTLDGRFTWRLPCLAIEPCQNPDGTNTVRAPDGVHFCPGRRDGYGNCIGYASGAFRYAMAMLAPIARALGR